ncbi:hypothetical protein Ct9H90mP29_22620 [bacterium]|nr:MAG: hypothetical protein Ct9H90mP29_22620 [bacterium]
MDWYNDNLFFFPENQGGFLFMITKSEIQNNLQKDDQKPIVARQTKFSTPDYSKLIPALMVLKQTVSQMKMYILALNQSTMIL